MRVLYKRTLKDGRTQLLIETAVNEAMPMPAFHKGGFYCIPYPTGKSVVPGFVLNDMRRVFWSVEQQKWVED